MNLLHPLVLGKFVVSRFIPITNYCKRCGKRAEVFEVDDRLWEAVVGPNARNERCLACFKREARRTGVPIHPSDIRYP